MSIPILVVSLLFIIITASVMKAFIPNEELRQKRKAEVAEQIRKVKHNACKEFIISKGISLEDIDSAVLALVSRENVFAGISFYYIEKNTSISRKTLPIKWHVK